MADTTNIEWCDSTFNPWIGCTRVSPACDDCYAARSTPARTLGVAWGAGQPRRRTGASSWAQPRQWQKRAEVFRALHGRRRRVFCASLADWLDNEVPVEWLIELLELIRSTPDLDWLLLSTRIGNWSSRISEAIGYLDEQTPAAYPLPLRAWLCHWLDGDEAPRNVWLGSTVVNQQEADRDVPKLLRVPAAVRFLSVEPMLGRIYLEDIPDPAGGVCLKPFAGLRWVPDGQGRCATQALLGRIDWVICGGEAGPQARPMHPDWARSLRDQCAAAGVPFLFKQWGEWAEQDGHKPTRTVSMDTDVGETLAARCDGFISFAGEFVRDMDDATTDDPYRGLVRIGKKAAGRLLDGRTHDEWPEVRHG